MELLESFYFFKGSSSDRIENIRISSKAVNKLIMPGEIVSYNETTGPRESLDIERPL